MLLRGVLWGANHAVRKEISNATPSGRGHSIRLLTFVSGGTRIRSFGSPTAQYYPCLSMLHAGGRAGYIQAISDGREVPGHS